MRKEGLDFPMSFEVGRWPIIKKALLIHINEKAIWTWQIHLLTEKKPTLLVLV